MDYFSTWRVKHGQIKLWEIFGSTCCSTFIIRQLGGSQKPIPSMYGIITYTWLFLMLIYGKCSRGVALGVEFEIGKGGHLRPLAESGHLRPLAATCPLRPLAATCGHLPSAATCGHLRPLALCGHLRSLAATCPLRPLAVTCGHLPSAVTCGHLRSLGRFGRSLAPAATCGHLRPLGWLQVAASDRE